MQKFKRTFSSNSTRKQRKIIKRKNNERKGKRKG